MNAKLEKWREALESKGFKISRAKIYSMECDCSARLQRVETAVRIEPKEIPYRGSFLYLGSIISKDEEIDEDVKHRIQAGWLK